MVEKDFVIYFFCLCVDQCMSVCGYILVHVGKSQHIPWLMSGDPRTMVSVGFPLEAGSFQHYESPAG